MSEQSRKILNHFLSKKGDVAMLFDVDETLKHPKGEHAPHRYNPNLPLLLYSLHQLGKVGIATDQSRGELRSFVKTIPNINGNSVFTGPFVLEGGHAIGTSLLKEQEIATSHDALLEIEQIYELVLANYIFNHGADWGTFPNVATPVLLPESAIQGVGSKSVWEKGPMIDDPLYNGEYEEVMKWLNDKAQTAGLLVHAALFESGNGTLRIIDKNVTKGTGLLKLQEKQLLDLSRVIFTGNGLNDVPAAEVIKEFGGLVVAVGNAHDELKNLADIVSVQPISDGVIEVFEEAI